MPPLKVNGFFLSFALFSLFPAAVPAAQPVYFLFQSIGADSYQFDGGFEVAANPQTAWEVLTDYNHISDFVSNMHSHVIKRQANDLLVDQVAGGGFLFINMTIEATLLIHEEPLQAVYFADIDHKHFARYEGVWNITAEPEGEVQVTYHLEAQRNKETPDFLTADLFCGSLGDLLAETRREIKRRQAKFLQESTPTPSAAPTPSPTVSTP